MKFTLFAPLLIVGVLLSDSPAAQTAKTTSNDAPQVFLRCSAAGDPDGVSDVHIDFAKHTFTDSFGTSKPFREEGPFLISETVVESSSKGEVVTTHRINRYTLEFIWMWPAQKILKSGTCKTVEKKL